MKRAVSILLFLLIFTSIAQAGIDVQLNSSAGDYVGSGLSYQYSDSDSTISLAADADRVSVTINQASSGQNWNLNFKTPGDFVADGYFAALRYPVQGPLAPGLSVTGNGRGCNQIAGRFVVHEVVVSNNVVQQLAVDFQQHCDASSGPLTGSVRVNSAVPVPYDLPVASAGNYNGAGFVEGEPMGLSALDSYSERGYTLSYQWSQMSGPPVVITAPNAAATSFVAPTNLNLGGEDFVFRLDVFDTTGANASDIANVHVASKSDPQTYLAMRTFPGGDFTRRVDWLYGPGNALFTLSSNNKNGVSATVSASNTWRLDFAPVQGNDLVPGHYEVATRFPFQAATEPGLSVSGYGIGCNTLTGLFDLWGNDGVAGLPNSFFVSFHQVCDVEGTILTGTLAVNALDPSVPVANAGSAQTVAELDAVMLDGSASSDIDGVIQSYSWTQIEGVTVLVADAGASQATFIAPRLPQGQLSDTLRFELVVTDDHGFKAKDEVTITLLPGHYPPIANDDQATTVKKSSVDIAVLNNDSDDVQLDVTSVRIVTPPLHGRVTVSDNGIVTYQPSRRFTGVDVFTYTVDDNEGITSNQATVTINVTGKP